MASNVAVAFQSPPSMEREVRLPNSGAMKGMVIPKGITLIVGGGFHGKSTLMQALEVSGFLLYTLKRGLAFSSMRSDDFGVGDGDGLFSQVGIYNHVPGDGREFIVGKE